MSISEMAKGDSKQSTNAQRGKETAKTGKQPGKPASQVSPKGPQPAGGKKK